MCGVTIPVSDVEQMASCVREGDKGRLQYIRLMLTLRYCEQYEQTSMFLDAEDLRFLQSTWEA